jgi:hypothetical protein
MPTEPKQEQSYLPWIAVAVLAFMLFQKQVPAPGPTPVPPAPVVNVESVVAGIFPAQAKGYAAIFSQAATRFNLKSLQRGIAVFIFEKGSRECSSCERC